MIGTTTSQYRTIDGLGEGGMGVVYEAENQTFGRGVALKFLPTYAVAAGEYRDRAVEPFEQSYVDNSLRSGG